MDGFTQNKKMHSMMSHGSAKCYKDGGRVKDDVAVDKKIAKKAIGMHDDQLHGGKETNLASLKKGGKAMKHGGKAYKKGGMVKKDKSMKKSVEAKSSVSAPKNITKSLPVEEPPMAPAAVLGGAPPMMKKGGKAKKKGGMVKKAEGGSVHDRYATALRSTKSNRSEGSTSDREAASNFLENLREKHPDSYESPVMHKDPNWKPSAEMKKGGKAKKKGGMVKKADGGIIGGQGGMGAMTPQDLMMLKKKLAMMGQQGAGGVGAPPAGAGPAPMPPAGAPPMGAM